MKVNTNVMIWPGLWCYWADRAGYIILTYNKVPSHGRRTPALTSTTILENTIVYSSPCATEPTSWLKASQILDLLVS